MCLTLPGKIITINQNQAQVNLSGHKIDVKIVDNNLKIGDWVLVYGDLIVSKISTKEAREIDKWKISNYSNCPN